ncbi:hypothetical protein [Halioxenophilus sp. WMMB6]|uniref:hypothetical protein n=1 Tax=Halioxenophilus sp. WMMB6 TaxID=3073815 RepID=UPI00295E810D|nr:hypothetical protein [Halioxenophilus sp. WMMB6]
MTRFQANRLFALPKLVTALTSLLLGLLASQSVLALDEATIKKFIACGPAIQVLDEQLSDHDWNSLMPEESTEPAYIIEQFSHANYKPFTLGLQALAERFPGEYSRFEKVVSGEGYPSAVAWGSDADAIMHVLMAESILQQQPEFEASKAIIATLPPDTLPESAKQQMQMMEVMITAAKKVPAADIELIRQYKPQLSAFFDKEGADSADETDAAE